MLSLNRIDAINSYEIDSIFFLNSFYQNKSDNFISTVEKIKIEEINSEKIKNVSNDDIINTLCKRLEPSSFFNREFNDVEDKTYFKKVDEFKILAKSLFEILYIIIIQQEISINNYPEILYCCSMFLGDEINNKWSTNEIRIISKDIIKTVNEKLNKNENSEEFNEKLLINKYYEHILLNKIKPLFNQPYRGSKTKKDFKNNIYDVQLWKTDHPASIYAFNWLTYHIETDQINKYFSNNVPIILTLIDDYQIPYKLLGVRLTNYCIINHTDPVQFRSTGLANVFLEALRLCLSFHSDSELMDESLPCIINLIKLMVNYNDPQNSPEFFSLVESIITEDIVKGLSLSIGKSTTAIYLKHVPLIVESIGIVSIRYLQIFVGPCCEILSFNYGDYKNQVYASKALLSLINVCIPRINKYIGTIMESTAECWRQLKKRENIRKDIDSKEQELKNNLEKNLKDIYKVLMQTKIKSVENNIALLQLIDPTIYQDLLEI
ncbi:hypothetical protein H8356DRAFT_943396 [Neocallimastix lanati (nom. inval.)]|uniref:ARM repeat-containing protein n=1 Tax=Neocallimastix californiae TaxID=1754190 RepID=A0A1Y2F382_9FUNG|nr:hypothetical protein H8356DRAFT_943396 [Neocallimastix sp. JGI-2020a]ORY78341.1 hypothetical protein LY90DRAFT_78833 [Neocallimastix californiae]|eukprot:ORY78341.1 hypothetical protein LY90DRAFT_78833 [Neocallimastix californiae]